MAAPVLLVHDDIATIASVRRLLAREGFEVILATSAADAIIAFGHYLPGLIVLAPGVEGGRGQVVLEELAQHPDRSLARILLLGESVPGFPAPVVPLPLDGRLFMETANQVMRSSGDEDAWTVIDHRRQTLEMPALSSEGPEAWRATQPPAVDRQAASSSSLSLENELFGDESALQETDWELAAMSPDERLRREEFQRRARQADAAAAAAFEDAHREIEEEAIASLESALVPQAPYSEPLTDPAVPIAGELPELTATSEWASPPSRDDLDAQLDDFEREVLEAARERRRQREARRAAEAVAQELDAAEPEADLPLPDPVSADAESEPDVGEDGEEAARFEAESRAEAERVAAEDAERLEAERLAAEEAERLEAEQLAAEEAEQVEAERLAAEESERVEAERLAAEEAERAEAERLAAEEAERVEAERLAAEEAERLAAEEAERIEAERLAAEEAERIEAERVAAEEAERLETERLAAEEADRLEAERLAVEEAERIEAERLAAEEAERIEAERLAAEEAERIEAERLAAEEAERIEAERLAAEEAERAEAERLAAEEAQRLETERLAAEEAERLEAERLAAQGAERIEAERLAAEEAERIEAERHAAEEAARIEAERLAAEEAERIEAERAAAEEAQRIEAERLVAEEAERLAAQQRESAASNERILELEHLLKSQLEEAAAERERLETELRARLEHEEQLRREAEQRAAQEAEERLRQEAAQRELEQRISQIEAQLAEKERALTDAVEREKALIAREREAAEHAEQAQREAELIREQTDREAEALRIESETAITALRAEVEKSTELARLEREERASLEARLAELKRQSDDAQSRADEAVRVAEAERAQLVVEQRARADAEADAIRAREDAEHLATFARRPLELPGVEPLRVSPGGTVSAEELARLVARFATTRADVRLDLRVDDALRTLWFQRGALVGAVSSLAHESLLQRARRDGLIDARQDSELRLLRGMSPGELLERLRARGYLRDTEVVPVVQRYTEAIALEALSEPKSDYRLSDEPPAPGIPLAAIPRHPLQLAFEALRRTLDGEARLTELGGLGAIPARREVELDLRLLQLNEREQRFFAHLDGETSIEELLLASGLRQENALRLLMAAHALEWIELKPAELEQTLPAAELELERLEAKFREVQEADYFSILGLPRQAGGEEVQRAFDVLSAEFDPLKFVGHPDVAIQHRARVVQEALQEAAQVLADDRLRVNYARHLVD